MLETKQNNYSTYQSRRNTEIMASRFIQEFKYDINDYLPNDYQVKTSYQFISFAKFDDPNTHTHKRSKRSVDSMDEEGDTQMGRVLDQISKVQESKNNQIKTIKQQFVLKEKALEERILQLQTTIQQIAHQQQKLKSESNTHTQKILKLNEQLNHQSETIKSLELSLANSIKQKTAVQTQLAQLKRKLEIRNSNIRMFFQKYEVNYQPKPKHSYTIQVQTDTQPTKIQPIPNISIPSIHELIKPYPSQSLGPEPAPNRRNSSSGKPPQLYQLYQQQQFHANEQFDLNSQVTSKSQVFPSNTKPRKPAFMQNPNDYNNDKQNDRKRLNQRLQSRLGNLSQEHNPQKQKKLKIKNEQIEIYPIDCEQVEDIVYGILAMK